MGTNTLRLLGIALVVAVTSCGSTEPEPLASIDEPLSTSAPAANAEPSPAEGSAVDSSTDGATPTTESSTTESSMAGGATEPDSVDHEFWDTGFDVGSFDVVSTSEPATADWPTEVSAVELLADGDSRCFEADDFRTLRDLFNGRSSIVVTGPDGNLRLSISPAGSGFAPVACSIS